MGFLSLWLTLHQLLQQEIFPAHALPEQLLKVRDSTYGKSVSGTDVTKRVRGLPKVHPDFLLHIP